MANSRVFFSDLKTGKCSSTVEARMLRFWETKNAKRGGEIMSINMLMVDVDGTMIRATIKTNYLQSFRPRLTAGFMYSVSGFDVCRCAQKYRLTDSSLMIRFNDSTSLDLLTDPISALPEEMFRLRNETDLLGLANSNTQLPDILGELTVVKSTVREPLKGKNHVMATINLQSGGTVIMSLFDSQAITFHRRIESMSVNPRVIVATNINPKMVGGRLFLNATSGTHIYFDKETIVGRTCLDRLDAKGTGFTSLEPLLGKFVNVEPLTIADLNRFATNAVSQDIEFMCTGQVSRVNTENGWCYVACSKCSKKLQRNESVFTCVRCNNPHADGALRYRVELAIADDTAEGVFLCFDGVMTKLHGIEAREVGQTLAEEAVNHEAGQFPPFITGMEGKTYTFHVKFPTYDFTTIHQNFTITRIVDVHAHMALPKFAHDGEGDNDGGDMEIANTGPVRNEPINIEGPISQVFSNARIASVNKTYV